MYIIGEEEVQAVRRVIESGQLFRYRGGEGGETDKFEKEWAERIGGAHALAVTSGTAALICGLVGLGIGPGDEVIVPAYTFMATALSPLAVGAVPILAEIDESLTIEPEDIERNITARTKAVIPVHMNGLPCNMDAVIEIARRHGLSVLEDACQADGGSYRGKALGSIGDAGAFSFNQFKIITCGEGGALVTSNRDIYECALIHHDAGCVFRGAQMRTPFFAGWNFRMNEILSAILRVQLQRLDGILAALRAEKSLMMRELGKETAFTFNPVHDPRGDCATTLGLLFESGRRARAFLERVNDDGIGAYSPMDSGRHVYVNWEPILQKLGAHHPGRDAYRLTEFPPTYSRDMCPRTLSVLERTVLIGTSAARSVEELMVVVSRIRKAASEL
jgi:dTDP-4-amino-4,6-dideoxygalactose transaminase